MNLVLDFGNTRIKAGVFDGDLLKIKAVEFTIEELFKVLQKYQFDNCIIATVVELSQETLHFIEEKTTCIIFNAHTQTPIRNLYQSKNTLGSDRLAACCGAYLLFKGQSFLVIDAGTCLKYNYTDKNGNFIGGGISPGLNMRFKAMHEQTNKLPLIKFDEHFNDLIGINTQNSLKMGAQLGMIAEVKGIIDLYQQLDPHVNIVLTGGDASYLQKGLKNGIFADPDLILKGLNSILNYQKK
ncbi:MAG TPA: type III pantothenate kinase [Bacteroidia bacterium]|nr:type III pantothenate kinase [Bacteroidia bacterium]